MHYAIIGTGPAGVVAAETLRKLDKNASITLVGDEPEPPYSRMALPYLLTGQIGESGTYLRKDQGQYEKLGITVLQTRVTKVDSDEKKLTLQNGSLLNFDKLLIASGSRPLKPPIPGIDLPGISHCWTLADARKIAENVRSGSRVVLMGAGFIGCIILEALVKRGAELTVVEMGERMVPRMMNAKAGGLIQRWCENKGVKITTRTTISAFEKRGDGLRVILSNGTALDADFVVSAAGVKANIEFLSDSGIKTDAGIVVDRTLQTSITDVYAAGDVAQGLDFSTGSYSVQAIQPTAVDHGMLAAKNMAGKSAVLHRGSVNMNVLDTMGLIACSFGEWEGREFGDSTERFDPDRFRYLNLQFSGETLIGATAIGLSQHIGVLRGLIQSKIKLGPWKHRLVDDPTRFMEAYLACTQAIGFNAELG